MQVVDANGNMFGYDHLEIIGADGKPKTTGGGGGPYVPYTGATGNVDLGEYELKAGQVEFDQTPTGTAGVAVMRWNDQDGTADLGLKGGNVTLQIGQEQLTRVVNKTGSNLLEANYQAVRISGAQGNRLKVDLAQANNDANSADTLGIVTETILNNQEGFITTSGLVRNIDTTGSIQGETWLDGDMLYLSGTIAGQITNIKPTAPIHTVIMGYVVRAHATQGQIYVKVDNGYELDELHNVAITSVANNDILQYDSATSLWKNESLSSAGIQPTITPGALTKVDDTNVTLTLGGSPSTALLQNTSLTLGWTGRLADSRIASASIWNAKQNALTLTTTGTSGPATLVGSTLNIPQYGGGAAFGVHSQKFIPSGSYTTNALNFGTVTSVGITANRLNVAPYFPNQSFTCQSLNIQVSGAIAGGLAKIVIYSDVNGVPSAKLYESADLDCSTTGVKTATLTFSFTAGTAYWIGVAGNNSLISLNFIPAASMYAFSTSTNLALYTYAQAVITYPTLPATLSTLTYIGNAFPFISIRKS